MSRCPPSDSAPPAGPEDISRAVDHLFRREYGRLVAILARRFGAAYLHLAEDVVQDALVKAMQVWPFTGVPPNPTAWILQTARNRAIDQTRRSQLWRGRQSELALLVEDCLESALTLPAPQFEDEIRDSQLRMMFVCCHPGLPPDAQVALTLKTLCGFGEGEIGAAFLCDEAAVTKRLVRARKFLRERRLALDLPKAAQLAPRLAAVQQALYLLFNEGYKASQGDLLVRTELCAEALRLAGLLSTHPAGDRPATRALLALMHLNAARLPARVDEAGGLLVLAKQDRTRWDGALIRRGLAHLAASGAGPTVSRFHLEAGIAACHCLAASYEATDWGRILSLYDSLVRIDASPVVALNRAMAVAQVRGADAGLQALEAISPRNALDDYHHSHALAGLLLAETGRPVEARARFERALALARLPAEKELLMRRIAAVS